jgi:hypothetical protein
MRTLLSILLLLSSYVFSQDTDYQQLCINCTQIQGFYCGDDPSNWTQYSPNGCVQNSWINDGWLDCVDGSDENEASPTPIESCVPPPPECDTVFIEIPFIEWIYDTVEVEVEVPFYIYETVIQLDTIVQTEYITQIVIDTVEVEVFVPEYIYVTDTLWMDGALDTLFVDVIEEVEVVVYDTIVETEYVEIFVVDTVIQYQDVLITEYIDCNTGLPCSSSMHEILEKSRTTGLIYNMFGQAIRKPEGIYIEDGIIKYKID